jgi:hypothetical protein
MVLKKRNKPGFETLSDLLLISNLLSEADRPGCRAMFYDGCRMRERSV